MNAKEEVLDHIAEANKTMSDISYGYIHMNGTRMEFEGHIRSHQLAILDQEYDSGYGGQELDGIIVFNDGSWLSRGEYDGSEWWEYNTTPGKDQVLQSHIDKRNLKYYREEIKKYTNDPTYSHLASTYQEMLQDLLNKGVKDD